MYTNTPKPERLADSEGLPIMRLPIKYSETHWSVRREARNQYIKQQNGRCCHCGELLSLAPAKEVYTKHLNYKLFPANFFKHPIHLHHSHKTDLTIGAVHARCNAVLWQYYGE